MEQEWSGRIFFFLFIIIISFSTLRIKYRTPEEAQIVYRALSVDRELSPEKATKVLSTDGPFLVASAHMK